MKTKTIKVKKTIEVDETVKIVEFIDFVEFLAKQGCASLFFHNSFSDCNSDYFRNHTPSGWLSGAFSWVKSPEGGSYWVNIDSKWVDFLHLHHITEGTY